MVFGSWGFLWGGVRSAIDAINIITVRSLQQKIIQQNKVEFLGDVEVLLDHKIHLWADKVEIDKEKQIIIAQASPTGFVKLENPDFLMLASYIHLDLTNKTGFADNIKIHIKEGYITSTKAEKIDEKTWQMEHITYTSCDEMVPHWAFTARRAALYKNSLLKASGLLFKISDIPVFAFPGLIFPLQGRAGSGFLMPRFSFDAELGFGFRQEYYWFLGSHCDTTVGFHCLQKKGFVLSDEFRWAQSPDNFLKVNGHYAKEWNALLERKGRIVSATDTRYWIEGKYFQPFSLGNIDIRSLLRFDFGTDKQIGYHFLSDAGQVEDSFYNTIIQRYFDSRNNIQLLLHTEKSLRKQFTDMPTIQSSTIMRGEELQNKALSQKREQEEKVTIVDIPHLEWNTTYYEPLPHVRYRHDLLIDHVFLESRALERRYLDTYVDEVITTIPYIDADTARFCYKGELASSCNFRDQKLRFFVQPYVQLRSNVRKNLPEEDNKRPANRNRYKLFTRTGVEWALPERVLHSSNYAYAHYIQSLLRWTYLPRFYQKHWHHVDLFDRFYPENKVEMSLRNNWIFNGLSFDAEVIQGYDFYDRSLIFPLRRCYHQNHLTPLQVQLGCNHEGFDIHITQEYSWKNHALLQSEIASHLSWDKFDFFLAYLYQKGPLQKERELLSDINSFALVGCSVPLGNRFLLHYDGSFYSNYKHAFPIFNIMKPTLHRVRLEYEGHCWGVSLGFEEKRYRQYGNWKNERAITFALRLESIGSFAQRFRRPLLQQAPPDYQA